MTEPPIDDPRLLDAYRAALHAYGGREGVSGVDVAYQTVPDRRTGVLGVRIHLTEGMRWIGRPEKAFLPTGLGAVSASVVVASYHPHDDRHDEEEETGSPRTRCANPIRPGVSVSHPSVNGGTIGLLVRHRGSCDAGLLSCRHVLAPQGTPRAGDDVMQPDAANGRYGAHNVGTLQDWIYDEDGDAAFARLNERRGVDPAQFESEVVVETARMPRIGEPVEKSGVGTEVTQGVVDGFGRYYLRRTPDEPPILVMDGFRVVHSPGRTSPDRPLARFGDSGAVWYSPEDYAGIGLHVAGSAEPAPGEGHAIACYLPRVLTRLNVEPLRVAAGIEAAACP